MVKGQYEITNCSRCMYVNTSLSQGGEISIWNGKGFKSNIHIGRGA